MSFGLFCFLLACMCLCMHMYMHMHMYMDMCTCMCMHMYMLCTCACACGHAMPLATCSTGPEFCGANVVHRVRSACFTYRFLMFGFSLLRPTNPRLPRAPAMFAILSVAVAASRLGTQSARRAMSMDCKAAATTSAFMAVTERRSPPPRICNYRTAVY